MNAQVREWVRKAEADLKAAERLVGGRPGLHDQVCFHCQQAGEKYLNALLQQAGMPVPRTHDLQHLLLSLAASRPGLSGLAAEANRLSRFAVAYRYPGSAASMRESRQAMRDVGSLREAVRKELGLRTKPRGRR